MTFPESFEVFLLRPQKLRAGDGEMLPRALKRALGGEASRGSLGLPFASYLQDLDLEARVSEGQKSPVTEGGKGFPLCCASASSAGVSWGRGPRLALPVLSFQRTYAVKNSYRSIFTTEVMEVHVGLCERMSRKVRKGSRSGVWLRRQECHTRHEALNLVCRTSPTTPAAPFTMTHSFIQD